MKKTKHSSKRGMSPYFKHFLIIFFITLGIQLLLGPLGNTNPKWQEPQRLKSTNKLLELSLEPRINEITLAGKKQRLRTYNEKYLGDTWEIKQGDTVEVSLTNGLHEPTNLHFHGSHVSPKNHSDNVIVAISPEEKFEYKYELPKDHPPGLYWYHPHLHPHVEDQVLGGMAGAVIIRGPVDELKGIKGASEKLLVLTTQDGNGQPTRLVNGMQRPTLYLRPYETTRLQVLNASADDVFNFSLNGQTFHIFSRDGNTTSKLIATKNEVMFPGERIELLFTPKMWYGEIPVFSLDYDQGFFTYTKDQFMTIKVQGIPMIPLSLPTNLPKHEDLRHAKVDKIRTLTFSEGGTDSNPTFLLDGRVVDMNRVDQLITLGTTEEWRLINNSGESHPFHIHINPFQVISVNGKEVDMHGYKDTYHIPTQGEVVMRTRYRDFDGKFVLHCHILFHEDHGMMQIVEIVKPGSSPQEHNGVPELEKKHAEHMNIMMYGDHDMYPDSKRDFR